MKPELTSLLIRLSTISGSMSADWRLSQIQFCEGMLLRPGSKLCSRPDSKYLVNSGSGCWDNSDDKYSRESTSNFFLFLLVCFFMGHTVRA